MDRQIIIFIMCDKMTDVAVSPEAPFFPTSQTDLHQEWNHGTRNVESKCTTEEAKYWNHGTRNVESKYTTEEAKYF